MFPSFAHILQNSAENQKQIFFYFHDGVKLLSAVFYEPLNHLNPQKWKLVSDKMTMSAKNIFRELENKYVGPSDIASLSCLSHCLRIHWSWKKKRRKTRFVSSSSVSSCDSSRVPFCSFCSSSCGFSVSFSSSSSALLRQMKSGTGCVSFSSSWPPLHLTMKQISFLTFCLCLSSVCASFLYYCRHHRNLYGAGHFAPASRCAELKPRRPRSPHCWCCLHPERCLSGGQL